MNEIFRKHTRAALAQIASLPPAPIPHDPHRPHSDLLPEIPRLAYRLHDVEGFGLEEIAAMCGIRTAHARRALSKARRMLQDRLA